jgi:hypothetical protein
LDLGVAVAIELDAGEYVVAAPGPVEVELDDSVGGVADKIVTPGDDVVVVEVVKLTGVSTVILK